MKQPLISVIVPVYNVEKYITKCLDSIIHQTYQELEIILVDDGSPDNCPAICDEYAQNDHRISVIHKINGGLSSARNVALDACKGEYIAFVDSDDWLELTAYDDMMTLMKSEDLNVVLFSGRKTDGVKIIGPCFVNYPTGTIWTGEKVTREILLDNIGSQVVQGLYQRQCWENVRFPLGRLYEDISTTFRVFAASARVGFLAKPYYNYRMNNEGISFSPNLLKPYHIYLGFKEHYEFAQQNYPDIAGDCCAKAAHYAISTCFNFYSTKPRNNNLDITGVMNYLKTNKRLIKQHIYVMPTTRRAALNVFYMSEGIFRLLSKTYGLLRN